MDMTHLLFSSRIDLILSNMKHPFTVFYNFCGNEETNIQMAQKLTLKVKEICTYQNHQYRVLYQ